LSKAAPFFNALLTSSEVASSQNDRRFKLSYRAKKIKIKN